MGKIGLANLASSDSVDPATVLGAGSLLYLARWQYSVLRKSVRRTLSPKSFGSQIAYYFI
jgi:hypothetical protein